MASASRRAAPGAPTSPGSQRRPALRDPGASRLPPPAPRRPRAAPGARHRTARSPESPRRSCRPPAGRAPAPRSAPSRILHRATRARGKSSPSTAGRASRAGTLRRTAPGRQVRSSRPARAPGGRAPVPCRDSRRRRTARTDAAAGATPAPARHGPCAGRPTPPTAPAAAVPAPGRRPAAPGLFPGSRRAPARHPLRSGRGGGPCSRS